MDLNLSQIPAEDRHHAIAEFAAWWESVSVEEAPPPEPQCGMCKHYQEPRTFKSGVQAWGFCSLRAAADLHPCNLLPWDKYAQQCPFFEEETPF